MRVGMYKLGGLQDYKFKKELVAVLEFDYYLTAEFFAEVFEVVSKYDPLGYFGPKLLCLSNNDSYPDSMLDNRSIFANDCWTGQLFRHVCPTKMWVVDETYMSWALNAVQQTTYVLKHQDAKDVESLVRHCYDKMDDGDC